MSGAMSTALQSLHDKRRQAGYGSIAVEIDGLLVMGDSVAQIEAHIQTYLDKFRDDPLELLGKHDLGAEKSAHNGAYGGSFLESGRVKRDPIATSSTHAASTTSFSNGGANNFYCTSVRDSAARGGGGTGSSFSDENESNKKAAVTNNGNQGNPPSLTMDNPSGSLALRRATKGSLGEEEEDDDIDGGPFAGIDNATDDDDNEELLTLCGPRKLKLTSTVAKPSASSRLMNRRTNSAAQVMKIDSTATNHQKSSATPKTAPATIANLTSPGRHNFMVTRPTKSAASISKAKKDKAAAAAAAGLRTNNVGSAESPTPKKGLTPATNTSGRKGRIGGGRAVGYVKYNPVDPAGKAIWAFADGRCKDGTYIDPATHKISVTAAKKIAVDEKKMAAAAATAASTTSVGAVTAHGDVDDGNAAPVKLAKRSTKRKAGPEASSAPGSPVRKRSRKTIKPAKAATPAPTPEENKGEAVPDAIVSASSPPKSVGVAEQDEKCNDTAAGNSGSSDEDIPASQNHPESAATVATLAAVRAASSPPYAPVAVMGGAESLIRSHSSRPSADTLEDRNEAGN